MTTKMRGFTFLPRFIPDLLYHCLMSIPQKTRELIERILPLHAQELGPWAADFHPRSGDSHLLRQLLHHVDESDYSIQEWFDALAGLRSSLAPELEVSPRRALGYLHCVMMTIDPTLARPPLREATIGLLNQYGIDPEAEEH